MRNSPRSLQVNSRWREVSAACTTILAEGMAAPLASWTMPRSAPRGFCAGSTNGRSARLTNKKRTDRKGPRRFRIECLLMSQIGYGKQGSNSRRPSDSCWATSPREAMRFLRKRITILRATPWTSRVAGAYSTRPLS